MLCGMYCQQKSKCATCTSFSGHGTTRNSWRYRTRNLSDFFCNHTSPHCTPCLNDQLQSPQTQASPSCICFGPWSEAEPMIEQHRSTSVYKKHVAWRVTGGQERKFRYLFNYLSNIHGLCLLEVGPWCVDHCDVVQLVALNGVGLDQLSTVLQDVCRYALKAAASRQTQVDVS